MPIENAEAIIPGNVVVEVRPAERAVAMRDVSKDVVEYVDPTAVAPKEITDEDKERIVSDALNRARGRVHTASLHGLSLDQQIDALTPWLDEATLRERTALKRAMETSTAQAESNPVGTNAQATSAQGEVKKNPDPPKGHKPGVEADSTLGYNALIHTKQIRSNEIFTGATLLAWVETAKSALSQKIPGCDARLTELTDLIIGDIYTLSANGTANVNPAGASMILAKIKKLEKQLAKNEKGTKGKGGRVSGALRRALNNDDGYDY